MLNAPPSSTPRRARRREFGTRWAKRIGSVTVAALVASTIALSGHAPAALAVDTASISGVLTTEGSPLVPLPYGSVTAYRADGSYAGFSPTAGDGSYSLNGLAAGSYTVNFAPNFGANLVPQWWQGKTTRSSADYFTVADGQAVTGIDATLVTGAVISGTISSDGTAPAGIPGAYVMAFAADGSYAGQGSADAAGQYSLGSLTQGAYTLDFHGPWGSSYLEEWWNDQPTRDSSTPVAVGAKSSVAGIDAVLTIGASITGHVSDADSPGTPIPNFQLSAVDHNNVTVGWGSTDGSGNYSITPIPAGTFTVQALSPFQSKYVGQWWNNQPTFSTAEFFSVGPAEAVGGKDFVLATGASISGTVHGRGEPNVSLANATVYAFGPDPQQDFEANTDSDGRYSIVGLTPGSYRIQFTSFYADNYGPAWWDGASSLAEATVVTVSGEQSVTGVDAVLEVGATISGTLRQGGPAGVELPTTEIDVINADGSTAVGGFSEPDGTFAISNLAEGSYTLHFSPYDSVDAEQWWDGAADLASATYFSLSTGQTRTGLDVLLAPPGIVGTIPTITGVPSVGQTLTESNGPWTPSSVSLTRQWLRNGKTITGAAGPSLVLTHADLGSVISVTVVGSANGYAPVSLTSVGTDPVTGPAIVAGLPTISGSPRVGKTLTALPGVWGPAPVEIAYQWNRNGKRIGGATRSKYVLTNLDAGSTISVTITGSKRGYATAAASSPPTGLITGGRLVAPIPRIIRLPGYPGLLSARAGVWGPGVVTLTYSWSRAGIPIVAAGSATYRPTPADAGKAITVTVTGSAAGFTTVSRVSRASLLHR
jgi:hypothetical protein